MTDSISTHGITCRLNLVSHGLIEPIPTLEVAPPNAVRNKVVDLQGHGAWRSQKSGHGATPPGWASLH